MTSLNAAQRRADLEYLAAGGDVDVLVIGGGVTGAGVALDAASRGLRVALVEAADLAFGTSRWSSKLVHGGLRYLAGGHLPIAYESAVERHHLMTTIAPHLVRPLRQVVPEFGSRRRSGVVRAGFRAGDMLRRYAGTPSSVLPGPARISALETIALCPGVRRDGLRGAATTADGQLVDDARLVIALARTAAAYGARICTYTRAEHVGGRRARLVDTQTGASFTVRPRAIVNATGVWAGRIDSALGVRPSRGSHLVFDASTFGDPTGALTVPIDGSISRYVFALPAQLGRVYVGLTDVEASGPIPDVAETDEDEIDFLLDAINVALAQEVTRGDILGTFAGLRPLIDPSAAGEFDGGLPTVGSDADGAAPLADVSRRHQVSVGDGLVNVIGGKLTTYRRMAEDAVDAAIAEAGLGAGPCVTTNTFLVGAGGVESVGGYPESAVARYGSEVTSVFGGAQVADPGAQIAEGIDVTRAEIEFAVRHEGALGVDDVLDRRTRIGLVESDARAARTAVSRIVEYVADSSAD